MRGRNIKTMRCVLYGILYIMQAFQRQCLRDPLGHYGLRGTACTLGRLMDESVRRLAARH